MKFRRATHDQQTGEYIETFRNLEFFQQKVWDAHGNVLHLMDSDKPITYDEILDEVRKDTTNYDYHPNDLQIWRDGEAMPDPKDVALSLVRLIEAGFVEVLDE
jgi:hypothetical protein